MWHQPGWLKGWGQFQDWRWNRLEVLSLRHLEVDTSHWLGPQLLYNFDTYTSPLHVAAGLSRGMVAGFQEQVSVRKEVVAASLWMPAPRNWTNVTSTIVMSSSCRAQKSNTESIFCLEVYRRMLGLVLKWARSASFLQSQGKRNNGAIIILTIIYSQWPIGDRCPDANSLADGSDSFLIGAPHGSSPWGRWYSLQLIHYDIFLSAHRSTGTVHKASLCWAC